LATHLLFTRARCPWPIEINEEPEAPEQETSTNLAESAFAKEMTAPVAPLSFFLRGQAAIENVFLVDPILSNCQVEPQMSAWNSS
jgi:hypothetical protein